MLTHRRRPRRRRAAAVVELAVVLPFLAFLFLVATDYCRAIYFSQMVTTCARNAALYLSDPDSPVQSHYPDLAAAARGDADPATASQMTVTSTSGTDSLGTYYKVTVTFPFTTISSYPGIPKTTTITRTALVRPAPLLPK
jgi:Flp pilus assembly protein TadG